MGFRKLLGKALKSDLTREIALGAVTGGPGGAAVAIVERLQGLSTNAGDADALRALAAAVDDLHMRVEALEKGKK